MIIELEINGARVIISGDNLTVNVTEESDAVAAVWNAQGPSGLPTPTQIKSLRKSLGQTQEKFSRRFGVAQATVCRWERGQENPNGSAAILLRSLIDGASA